MSETVKIKGRARCLSFMTGGVAFGIRVLGPMLDRYRNISATRGLLNHIDAILAGKEREGRISPVEDPGCRCWEGDRSAAGAVGKSEVSGDCAPRVANRSLDLLELSRLWADRDGAESWGCRANSGDTAREVIEGVGGPGMAIRASGFEILPCCP